MITTNVTKYKVEVIDNTYKVSTEVKKVVVSAREVVAIQNIYNAENPADLMLKSDYDKDGDGMIDEIDGGGFHL